jgi:hypothetical protein
MPALYIVLERPVAGLDSAVDGKALSRHEAALSNLCQQLAVPSLFDFYSENPAVVAELLDAELFEDEGRELDRSAIGEVWFSAAEGLQTVQTLLDHAAELPEAANIVDELLDFEIVLKQAVDADVRWHLAVDF